MGIIPDKMVRADATRAWWETSTRKAVQKDSAAGLDEWSQAAGLDFTVKAMESGFYDDATDTWHKESHRRTIVRTDNMVGLGHFTAKYKIHQPAEICDFFRNFLLVDSRFKLSTMGSMKGGALIWGLAEFESGRTIAGDAHKLYCLLGTSYNGMWATFASATAIRAVCQNTIEATIYTKDNASPQTFRIPHSMPFDSVNQAKALEALQRTTLQFDAYRDFAESLASIKMTRDETIAMLTKLATGKDHVRADDDDVTGRTKATMADMVYALDVTHAETGEFNAWAALNAVTRFADHDRTTRRDMATKESEGQARLFSANFGTGAKLKRDAVKLLDKQYPGTIKLADDARELVAA